MKHNKERNCVIRETEWKLKEKKMSSFHIAGEDA
jgi:hypothetical protein